MKWGLGSLRVTLGRMNGLIEEKRLELERICRLHHVRQIDLFGSATRDDFDREQSDLDFLVTFEALAPGQHADAYFGLLEGLETLFGRHVDLVVATAIKNPYFRQAVESSKTLVYAA